MSQVVRGDVLDVKKPLSEAAWSGEWKQDRTYFERNHRPWLDVTKGLDVLYFFNAHDWPVHDRNGERKRGGKQVIPLRRGAIRPHRAPATRPRPEPAGTHRGSTSSAAR